jgi:iron complex outermembrane receptor protein
LNLIEVILAQGSMHHAPSRSHGAAARARRPAIDFLDITMATIRSFHLSRSPIAAAAVLLAVGAQAQTTTLAPVSITGRGDPAVSVSGWGDIPLSQTPIQASVFSASQMRDRDVQRLADIARIDPSISDAYNSEGYWDFLAVRGFVLDNRFNYRRDGLPINAETSIPLDNKDSVEVLKGASGIQAGTSAPGGLVNLVVKRPTDAPIRSAQLGWREAGSVVGAVDLSQRFGEQQGFGVRVNAAYERLDPQLYSAKGERHLLAAAGDWRLSPATLLEAEFETSHRSQPSQPGFSMLGSNVPAPGDPRINLNNQPWSQPVVMDANNASLRITHKMDSWRLSAHAATQRLKTDDRLAFPYGCTAEGNWDRYCSDGTYDLYDFRSENERRRTDALEIAAHGETKTGDVQHNWSVGTLFSKVENRFGPQTYDRSFANPFETDPSGIGNIEGTLATYPNNSHNDTGTNRDERSTELFARDALKLTENSILWLGLRHTRLTRESVRTDGTRPTDYSQSFTTPWLAASYTLAPEQMIYASWGQGVESDVAPGLPQYTNQGQALPGGKSRQIELGLKVGTPNASWGIAWFDITRPVWDDTGLCDGSDNSCTRIEDGEAQHQGIEANAALRTGAWVLQGGVQALRARRHGSQISPDLNGKRPTNVPEQTLKLQARYHVPELAGLSLQADARGVSNRMVLEDNSVSVPGYGVADLSARYEQKLESGSLIWRAGVDNLFDRRAWRESPFQFGHVYLYPLAPRTFRLSMEVSL